MKSAYLKIFILSFLGLIGLSAPWAQLQSAGSEQIEKFDAVYEIQPDGSVNITERILYDFGSEDRHGIFRTIPNRFTYGVDTVNLQITVQSVTDENGTPYIYEESGLDDITVKIGDPDATISGLHWYVITYSAQQAVQSYSDHDELYWNVTGTEWSVPINHATATVILPETGDPSQYRTACYAGSYGTADRACTADEPANGVFTYAADYLNWYEGLTIVAGFQTGLVSNPFEPTMIDEFITDIEITEDGTADVLNLFHFRYNMLYFESSFQMSFDRGSLTGEANEYQDIEILSVADQDGKPYEYMVIDNGDPYRIEIEVPRPTMDRWYSVHYTIPHAVEQTGQYDELIMQAINDDWPVAIENVTAFVSLPPDTNTERSIQWCYTGMASEGEIDCTTLPSDQANRWAYLLDYMDAYTPFVVSFQFDSGIATPNAILYVNTVPSDAQVYLDGRLRGVETENRIRTSAGEHLVRVERKRYLPVEQNITLTTDAETSLDVALQKNGWWVVIETYVPIGVFIMGSFALLAWWWVLGRDPKGRGTIIPQYEPPEHMTPGELGVVVDGKAHIHDITSTFIDLAVRGYLIIKKTGEDHFTFVKQKEADDALLPFETKVFRAIFPQTSTQDRTLSDMKNKFYTHLPEIRRDLYGQVVKAGYYKSSPHVVRVTYISLAVLGSIGLTYGALFFGSLAGSGWYVLLAGLGLEALILSFIMTKRTRKGAETYEHILGLKQYLTVAEQSRLKFHQSPKAYQHHFEQLLPYAIALQVEKDWVKLFDGMFTQPLEWYQSDLNTFNSLLFMNALNNFEKTTAQTVVSAPSSSGGGSGFSGGGFSGGGFGGGGGGSW